MNGKHEAEISAAKDSINNLCDKFDSFVVKQDDFRREIEHRIILLEVDKKGRDTTIAYLKRAYIFAAIGLFFGLAQSFIIGWVIDSPVYKSSEESRFNYEYAIKEDLKGIVEDSVNKILKENNF